MAMYVHGNLAMEEQVNRETVKVREIKRKVYRKKAIPVQEKLLYLFTVLLCVIVAGTIIWRYAQIYEMNTEIHTIETQIKALQAENDILKQQWNKANDPERLRIEAEKTGLSQLDPDEITHVPSKPSLSKSTDNKVAFNR
ncbi:cell division protein FtsL [Paenibacillus psychroresistens]|uniref:Cell division protein FtsL n=1 Tax=Paenibacillus psychroresistens TaxID=1778678 RepID=A0A6B8RH23_9BACL|nr:cell division protein FtsL [Paenibacillus psychroresistens]QGQ95771.1 cell division protein FtsL [Paenibacillus psychroresistens]